MKNKKSKIISILIITFLCACYTIKNYDKNKDTFYLIKIGEYILNHGIDFKEHFSFIQGLTYTYPHWLYSVYVYIIYNKFGFLGVHINNIISFILLILSIYMVNLKVNKNDFLALFVSIISIFILGDFIVARGQVFSTILLFLEVYFINKLIETGNKKYIIFLMISSLLIANIHGTIWLMFFIFFMPFFGEQIIYLLIKKKNRKRIEIGNISIEKVNNIKLVFVAFILCLLMGLLTPSRICYTYVFKTMLGDSQKYINEHQPLQPIKEPWFIFITSIFFFIKGNVKLRDLFMIIGIIILSLISVRYICFFYTIVLLYLTKLLVNEFKNKKDNTLELLGNIIFNRAKVLIPLLVLIIIVGIIGLKKNLKGDYINKKVYPTEAVEYIKKNLDYKNIRMYNDYDIGSYILFNDIPVFIDPRCDLYFKEFNKKGLDVFDDAINLYKKITSYKEIFEKYNINYALFNKNDNLYYIIKEDKDYEEIYKDENFVILKKKSKDDYSINIKKESNN